ncbi:hypothetical protein BUALT_Bualt08G0005400 [Buddleja alternifolia]|uniref:Uncharacterized protein n=1 Tax=Buddleja alternifolia TaxID=168488 RepID=A0AAV6X991_9LAMI|nr:hypothetical protein BUALT_Bualt08G0005400 [Buddleja alternifolia]
MAFWKWKMLLTRLAAKVNVSPISPRMLLPPPWVENMVFLSSIRYFSKKIKPWRLRDQKYIKKQDKKTWNPKEKIIFRCDTCGSKFGTIEELDKHKKQVHGDNEKTKKGKQAWKTAEGEVKSDLRKYRSVIDVEYENDEGEKDVGDDEGEQDVHNDEGKKDMESDDGRSSEDEGSYVEHPEEARLFVGNFPYQLDKEQLAKAFEGAGVVQTSEVVYDKFTNRSRGFGFVTMGTVEEANKAMEY